MADKMDLKRHLQAYFSAPKDEWELRDFPGFAYLMIDGEGAPGGDAYKGALERLYPAAYAVKFASKQALGRDYVVPPLEGLWWAADMAAYGEGGRREEWQWTLMLMLPAWIEPEFVEAALAGKAAHKSAADFSQVRYARLAEGLSLQHLHLGSFAEEAPKLAQLHHEIMPARSLTFRADGGGRHHEIYLSDPRRTAPEKLRTILRQPVARK